MPKAWIEKITVEGFKSYGKDRVEIPIGKGFVAIVGPNGAGKSNIGDAISFALGLATAKTLRAKNLSYLIYTRGEERADYAYVEVHFKNYGAFPTEEEDVFISRKVYPDGRTVFKINGTTVREKDLMEFLSHAGIYESAYNVVLQGDIIRFLKMTPVERRKLIEEISGIGEYEEKKQKALEDLGEVELKIRELSLLIDEMEIQMERLSEEVKRVQRYKEVLSKKREREIKLYMKEAYSLSLQTKELDRQLQALQEEVDHLKLQIDALEAQLKESEGVLQTINEELFPYKEKVGRISSDIDHISQKVQELHRRKIKLEEESITGMERIKNLEETLKALKEEERALILEIEEKEKELLKYEDEYSRVSQTLKDKEEGLRVSLEEAQRTEEKLKDLREDLETKRKVLMEGEVKVKEIDIKKMKVQEDITTLEGEAKTLKEELGDASLKMENYNRMLKDEEVAIKKKRVELEEQEGKLKNLRREKEEILKEIAILESKLKSAEAQHLPFEGVRGVYGRVADLIRVKDLEYLKAVESAGGARLSYVVVQDEDTAKECINILKELRMGRMNFIPLNRIKDVNLPSYPRVRGAIDFVVNLVEYDKKLEKAVRFVFGDTLVVEDFESAKRIGIGTYRMVSLDGEVFEKSGVISGGYMESKGELGREFYLKELQRLYQVQERIKKDEESIERLIKSLRDDLLEKESAVKVLQRRIRELEERDKRSFERIRELEEKIKKAREYIHILEVEKQRIVSERTTLLEDIQYLQEKIENLSLKRQSIVNHYMESGIEDIRQRQEKVKKLLDNRKEEIFNLSLKLKEKEKERENIERELQNIKLHMERASQEIKDIHQKILYLEEERRKKEEELKDLESKAYQLYKSRDKLEEDIRALQSQLGRLKLTQEEKREKLIKLESDRVRMEERVKELMERLSTLGWEGELQEVKEPMSKLKEELNLLNREIELYSNVNLRAEEDYQEYQSRHQDLTQKYKKAQEEKRAIKELIEEVETKKLGVFMEAYNAINKNLKRIFSRLSPGGKAYMVLEKEDDPFSGGVNLVVKPRGKEVQYLEAISGGEKTLAALSLIFGIQDYKPSVFYYFDEVDAHLDEANARKVGELIKERSSDGQFIVVTLREAMAEYAQKLIGVSARAGISKVFPIENKELLEVHSH